MAASQLYYYPYSYYYPYYAYSTPALYYYPVATAAQDPNAAAAAGQNGQAYTQVRSMSARAW